MSDAEKIAADAQTVVREWTMGKTLRRLPTTLADLEYRIEQALLAAEARGYAAAREQAAGIADAKHNHYAAEAIRKIEPNT